MKIFTFCSMLFSVCPTLPLQALAEFERITKHIVISKNSFTETVDWYIVVKKVPECEWSAPTARQSPWPEQYHKKERFQSLSDLLRISLVIRLELTSLDSFAWGIIGFLALAVIWRKASACRNTSLPLSILCPRFISRTMNFSETTISSSFYCWWWED